MKDKIKDYWESFCKKMKIPEDTKYEVWSFGNTKDMADELVFVLFRLTVESKLLQLLHMSFMKKMKKFQRLENTILS